MSRDYEGECLIHIEPFESFHSSKNRYDDPLQTYFPTLETLKRR